jgi:hypothetical protein
MYADSLNINVKESSPTSPIRETHKSEPDKNAPIEKRAKSENHDKLDIENARTNFILKKSLVGVDIQKEEKIALVDTDKFFSEGGDPRIKALKYVMETYYGIKIRDNVRDYQEAVKYFKNKTAVDSKKTKDESFSIADDSKSATIKGGAEIYSVKDDRVVGFNYSLDISSNSSMKDYIDELLSKNNENQLYVTEDSVKSIKNFNTDNSDKTIYSNHNVKVRIVGFSLKTDLF